jgi:hypothetical protein
MSTEVTETNESIPEDETLQQDGNVAVEEELAPKEDLVPPEEAFWEKYSPHYEFPLSMVGSILITVVVIGLFLIYVAKLLNYDRENISPPIRAMVVGDGGLSGDGSQGSGGGQQEKQDIIKDPSDPVPPIPDISLQKVEADVVTWSPNLQDNPDFVKVIAQSPNLDKLKKMNDDLRRRLIEGVNSNRGSGNESGTGNTKEPGPGSSGKGSGNSTGERTLRWTLSFSTSSGKDYLNQLAMMKAKLLIPQPQDWQSVNLISDLGNPGKGEPIDPSSIREMIFVDDRAESVASLCRALGLDFVPPQFIAVFPKSIEDELAAKEIAFRGRRPNEIASTTFKILIRDGSYTITVTEQKRK